MSDQTRTRRQDSGQLEGDGSTGSGNDRRGASDQQERRQASLAEKGVIVISIAFTLLLFIYAGWQIATEPAMDVPQVSVVETEALADGRVAVTVRLRNPNDVGLVSATVQSSCSSPPAEVQFSYVPASATSEGTVVCPSGTTDPSVSLANWVSQ